MTDYWEKIKRASAENAEFYKNKFNKTYHQVSDETAKASQVAKDKIPDIQRGARAVTNHASKAYEHIGNVGGSVSRFYRFTRYSMVAAGTGIFLYGVGYALRPVADIYKEHNRKSIEE
jgi:prophage DNA circulation protein